MTLASAIYAAIQGLESQVYPVIAPQEADPPWLTYRIDQSSDEDELSYQINGQMNPYWATFYLTVWTKSYAESDAKATSYLDPLLKYSNGFEIQKIIYLGRQDLADPDLNLFGIQLKLKCFTVEV